MRCWRQHLESQPHHPSPSSHAQSSRIICYLCKLECSGLVAVSWMCYGYSHPSLLRLLGSWMFLSSMLGSDTMGLVLLFWPLQKGFRNTVKHGGKNTTCPEERRKATCVPFASFLFFSTFLFALTFKSDIYKVLLQWSPLATLES